MTVDERLDRLTERHEALRQSVVMLRQDLRESAAFCKQAFTATNEGMRDLLAIARSHESRMSDLAQS